MQVYATTSEAPVHENDSFYNLLQMTTDEQDNETFLFIMRDYNAKVGTNELNAGGTIGKFGYIIVHEAGERLIQFPNVNDLVSTHTCFKQAKDSRVWTWESPDGRTRNMIDYILIKRK